MTRRIIMDCDPGHDDAIALLAAHGSPALELVAVTTVCGNRDVDRVTANALAVGTAVGMDGVLFARGAERPLAREHRSAADIHGESGLDGPVLEPGRLPLDPRPAAELIVDLVAAAAPGELTLVATAPLTNLALALRRAPGIAGRVREVAIMGGAIGSGNVTPSAEFNLLVDPEAAREVFAAPWSVTMMGLEVSHRALATAGVRARLAAMGTRTGVLCGELLDFFGARYLEHQGFPDPPVHDLCPIVHLIDPTVFQTVTAPVDVETAGELTLGRTVVDLRPRPAGPARHRVATGIDPDRFWDVALDALARLP
jgi:purine nucleosidase